MFKVEVGNSTLTFMAYSRIIQEIDGISVENDKNSFYAILYDFGMPVGCGRLKIEDNLYIIDNIRIYKDSFSNDLVEDIKKQLLRKANTIGIKEKKQ
jgi:hypothetical protein